MNVTSLLILEEAAAQNDDAAVSKWLSSKGPRWWLHWRLKTASPQVHALYFSAFKWALCHKNESLAALLEPWVCNVNAALEEAASVGMVGLVSVLLPRVDLEGREWALYSAANAGHTDVMDLLVSCSAVTASASDGCHQAFDLQAMATNLLVRAMVQRDKTLLCRLAAHIPELFKLASAWSRGMDVAASCGWKEGIDFLLVHSPVDGASKDFLSLAACCGHEHLVNALVREHCALTAWNHLVLKLRSSSDLGAVFLFHGLEVLSPHVPGDWVEAFVTDVDFAKRWAAPSSPQFKACIERWKLETTLPDALSVCEPSRL